MGGRDHPQYDFHARQLLLALSSALASLHAYTRPLLLVASL